jgi:[ribosomal protein S18]-alanine N-acetyltransferase
MASILRQASASDYETIVTWLPDAEATRRWAGPRVTFPFTAPELELQVQVPGGKSYVLQSGAAVVAYGQHWVLAKPAVHLGRLIVAPTHRGKGLGRELCVQLIAAAIQATGASAVTLRVYRDNTNALALYRALGFKPEAEESEGQVLFMRRDDA